MLVAAVVVGLVAALITGNYLSALRNQAVQGAKPVKVLVAKEDIPKGITVDELQQQKKLEQREVPQQYVASGAISTLRTVDGQVLAIPLAKGEQLTTSRFQFSSQAGLAFSIPKGFVAVTIPTDDVRGVAGLIKPGDNIAVVTSIKLNANDENSWTTKILLPGARVLAVGRNTGAEAETPKTTSQGSALAAGANSGARQGGASNLTLALSPADAQRVVLAQEMGRIWIALLPTEEKSTTAGSGLTRSAIYK